MKPKETRSLFMDNKAIGNFISIIRKSKHMTQLELADKLGVTNKAISKWETGEGYPEITIIPDLATELGITVDELLAANLNESSDTYMTSLIPLNQRYNEIIKFMKLNSIALAFILTGLGSFIYFHTWSWNLALLGFAIMLIMSVSSIFIIIAAYSGIKNLKLENPDNNFTEEKNITGKKLRRMFLNRITGAIVFIAATIPFVPSALANRFLASFAYFMWLIVSSICAFVILFFIYRNTKEPNIS